MKYIVISILLCSLLLPFRGVSDVRLPKLVADNMVLQRDTLVPLWGWAAPGEKVTVFFQKQKKTVITAEDGKWHVALSPLNAGGPFEMKIEGKNKLVLKNVLVGDVFLASGQSNMEFSVYSVDNSKEEISKANYPDIHFLIVTLDVANAPVDTMQGNWQTVSPNTVGGLSGVAYFFARDLQQKINVPIGIIQSAWSGSVAEAWTNAEALKEFPSFKDRLEELKTGRDWTKAFHGYEAELQAFKESDEGIKKGVEKNTYDDSNWKTTDYPISLKGLGVSESYGNNIWIRKTFTLVEKPDRQYEMNLGQIGGDVDIYINGQKISEAKEADDGRVFIIPAQLLKDGKNKLAIKFMEIWGGKIGDNGQKAYLVAEGGSKIVFEGKWRFNTTIEKTIPPYLSSNYTPSTIYNAMIAPLIPYAIKGAIWYQGESNADRAFQYQKLFPAMIKGWRKKWGYDFPFLFVQLANYMPDKADPADYEWAELREAQTLALSLPKTGMAVAIDVGDKENIHPTNKQEVGRRLTLAAEHVIYGNNEIVYSGPTFQKMTIDGNKITISFHNTGSGLILQSKYGYVRGFAIAGADKKFVWATGYRKGNKIIVYNNEIDNPVSIRYNWSNSPDGNIYNQEGLPAVPFRTDNFPGITQNK